MNNLLQTLNHRWGRVKDFINYTQPKDFWIDVNTYLRKLTKNFIEDIHIYDYKFGRGFVEVYEKEWIHHGYFNSSSFF